MRTERHIFLNNLSFSYWYHLFITLFYTEFHGNLSNIKVNVFFGLNVPKIKTLILNLIFTSSVKKIAVVTVDSTMLAQDRNALNTWFNSWFNSSLTFSTSICLWTSYLAVIVLVFKLSHAHTRLERIMERVQIFAPKWNWWWYGLFVFTNKIVWLSLSLTVSFYI